ncbi:hypothetical protein [Streptomyces sp. NPDC056069]|uniref:hypothetical protein n=1 Tax=Streptomyces sp. NPDC056069 TaxID=3345702 RepID=UPI0035D9AB47
MSREVIVGNRRITGLPAGSIAELIAEVAVADAEAVSGGVAVGEPAAVAGAVERGAAR